MNKKTILELNSTASVRPAAWFALAILALGAFGNSVQAQWVNENFSTLAAGVAPTATLPLSKNGDGFALGVSPSGGALQINTTGTTLSSETRWSLSDATFTTPRTSGYISFKIQQNANASAVTGNYMNFRVGPADSSSMGTGPNTWLELRFKQSSSANLVISSAGGANQASVTISSTAQVPIQIWYNQSGSPISYTRPDTGVSTSLATGTFAVFANNVAIVAPGTFAASVETPAVTTAIGKFAFTVSTNTKVDFTVDDIYAAATPPSSGVAITSPTTATAQAGYPFSYTIASSGVTSPVYSTSTLPSGLSLNSSTGVISGTISAAATQGLSNITLTATGTGGPATGSLGLTITAPPAAAPVITSAATATGKLTQTFSYQITTGTTSPLSTPTSYAIVTGNLPSGLTLNTSTGAITGTPNGSAGVTVVTYTATNPTGTSAEQTLTITVDPAPVFTWNNTGTAYTSAGSWTNNSGFPSTTNDATVFGNVGSSTFTNVIVGTAQTNGGITFNPNAYAYNWTGSDITVASAGGITNSAAAIQTFGNKVINSGGDTTWSTASGGSLVFNGGIDLTTSASSASRTLTFAGAGNVTVNSVIADGGTATAGAVVFTNTGTTTLSGNNTYRGTTKVAAGTLNLSGTSASSGYILAGGGLVTLKVNAINALNPAATLTGASGSANVGTLEFATAGNYTLNQYLGQNMNFSNSSGLASTLTFTNATNTLGTTTTGKTFANKSTDLTIIFKGDVDISGTTTAANTISTIGPVVISNRVYNTNTGVRSLIKDETNTLTMYGVNSYNGTTVSKGILSIPTGGSLVNCGTTVVAGSGTSAANSASLNLAGAAGVVQVGINGYVRGGGSITSLQVQSAGTVEVPVGSTWTTVGTIEFLTGSKVSVTGTPVSGQTYTLLTATGDITGTPTLVSSSNTVGWALRVTGPSIYLEEVGVITIASGSQIYSVANTVTGSIPLTKRGAGTLILDAANDYSGGTVVEAGTLQVQNVAGLGTGAVTLKGGTLKNTVDLDLAKLVSTTSTVGATTTGYTDTYGLIADYVKYTGNSTTLSGPVTLDVATGTTMTMLTLVGNSDANSLVTKIGAGTVKVMGGSTKLSDATALAANGNGSTVLGGWRIQGGTVWFAPSSNNGGGNGPITLAGGNAKFTKLQNSNGTFTGFEVPSDLTVENDGLIQYDPSPLTLLGQNNLGFKNLSIGGKTLQVATDTTSTVQDQVLPSVNFKSATLTGSATLNNPASLDLNLQAVSGTGGFTKTGLGTLYLSDQPNQAAAFATLKSTSVPTTVESINVEYAGSGYTAAPAVTLVGGGATTQATATATIDAKGRVTSIAVNTAGSGYTSLPRVVIAAPATALTANSYTGATIVEQGNLNLNGSYASSFTVKSGAALKLDWLAPAQARCSIDAISSGTSGYLTTPANAYVKDLYLTKSVGGYTPGATLNLTIAAPSKTDGTGLVPGGVAATATATVNSDGIISALNIVSGGSGYVVAPMVTIPAPTVPTVVARTTGSVTFESGARLSLNISPTSASYTLLTADGGITGNPVLETSIPGYALTKSSNGKSLLLEVLKTTPTISVTPAVGGYRYTGSYQGPGLDTVNKPSNSTGEVTFSYSGTGSTTYGPSAIPPTDAGTYSLSATVASDSYYNQASSLPAAFEIRKAAITVTAAAKNKTYGQADPALTYQVSSGALVGSDALMGSLSRAVGENVGSYAISSTLANANYDVTFVPASLTIGKAAITVTAAAKNKTYGQADPALTYAITSGALVGTDALAGSLSRVVGENVGSYAINSTLANANYDVTFVPANLVIAKAAITVTADAGKSKKAGEADPVFTYRITNGALVGSDVLTGSLSRVAGEAVGTYDITQGTLAAGSNYDLTYTKASFEIQANGPTFASAFGGAGATAVGADGMANLLRYAMGANTPIATVVKPVSSLDANNLSITAIVRINDPKVSIVGQSGTSLSAWSATPIVGVRTTDQTGAVAGETERQVFSVPRAGQSKTFLRLSASLSN